MMRVPFNSTSKCGRGFSIYLTNVNLSFQRNSYHKPVLTRKYLDCPTQSFQWEAIRHDGSCSVATEREGHKTPRKTKTHGMPTVFEEISGFKLVQYSFPRRNERQSIPIGKAEYV